MTETYAQELRRIRITLIIMVIVLLFSGGDTEVIHENDANINPELYFENMISFGEDRFGILSGDASYPDGRTMTIYQYDSKTNHIMKLSEIDLDELGYEE